MDSLSEALAAETIGGPVWFYSDYHCNLQCSYCLTESAPVTRIRSRTRSGGRRASAR